MSTINSARLLKDRKHHIVLFSR